MKARKSSLKQRGFSLLTGFILAIIMFGTLAFFLGGQGINSSFGTAYANTSKVSGLLTSAGYISTGFDAVAMSGQVPSSVTFDTAVNTGVFNPSSGGASQQMLDPTLFVGTDTPATATAAATGLRGYWIYRQSDVKLNAVGTAANPEFTIMATGLKQGVCQQINATLHGSATTPLLTGITQAALVAGTPPAAGSNSTVSGLAVDLSVVNTGIFGRTSGCYVTSDSQYVFIHTLLAQ